MTSREDELLLPYREDTNSRRKLFQALYTRVLTDDEMQAALLLEDDLNVGWEVYNPHQKKMELMNAWYVQNKLQLLKRLEAKGEVPV